MCDGHHHQHHEPPPHTVPSAGLKIAITGKGGVGKTTLAALLARSFAAEGRRVLAIDADPDANLAAALGIAPALCTELRPIAKMKELAAERTGAEGGYGSLFRLNPTVADLPEQFCVESDGVHFLWMGTLERGGSGCACPESTLVKRLMSHLLLERGDVLIIDMEAGIEHLGRGTAAGVDALITVVEPGGRSVQTAGQIGRLAADIGIRNVFAVGSKVGGDEDRRFIEESLPAGRLLGFVSLNPELARGDREGIPPHRGAPAAFREATAIGKILQSVTGERRLAPPPHPSESPPGPSAAISILL